MKPHNILLNKSNDALVADLGTVRHSGTGKNADGVASLSKEEEEMKLEAMDKNSNGESGASILLKNPYNDAMTSRMGTPMYMAPEQQGLSYTYPVDVWAFGLILVRLFTLKLPYPEKSCTVNKLTTGVRSGRLNPIQVNETDVPNVGVLNVINNCLNFTPSKRPTFKNIEFLLSSALEKCKNEVGSFSIEQMNRSGRVLTGRSRSTR